MNVASFLYVGAGGALGAIARYGLSVALPRAGMPLPYGTLLANLLGCLLMGGILQWLAESDWHGSTLLAHEPYRLLFAVGFCGSFTTMSALVYELSGMLQRDSAVAAFAYLSATLIGGFLCFYAGIAGVRLLLPSS